MTPEAVEEAKGWALKGIVLIPPRAENGVLDHTSVRSQLDSRVESCGS
jgi:hypothetical protein